jgi:hypothetical protein
MNSIEDMSITPRWSEVVDTFLNGITLNVLLSDTNLALSSASDGNSLADVG